MHLHRFCSALLMGVLSLFGFSAFAATTDKPVFISSAVLYAIRDVGHQGESLAKFQAVHSMLTGCSSSVGSLGAGLRRDSHGYLQASADDFQGWNQNGTSQLSLT